jgi:threonine dehydrogenase-like Zn-dependent dehydrogenase
MTAVETGRALTTMRAATLAAPGRFDVGERPRPHPERGQVLVRVEGCGVCASSLPLWHGRPWFEYPLPSGAPGHEAWGRLDDGTRVAVLTQTGFAAWTAVSTANVVALPQALDGLPFPGEAFACAVTVVRRSDLSAGARVAVVGMGFLGSGVAQLCRAAGADVVEVRRGEPVDGAFVRVIECAGTQSALDTASRLVAEGGRLVLAGFHQDGPRVVDLQSWNWRGIDVVNAHERDSRRVVDAMREAARLAAAGVLDVERLVTHRFELRSLAAAFAAATERRDGFVKAWVAP